MAFRALVTDRGDDGTISNTIMELGEESLPQGDVLVGIEWAGFNYKDGMVLAGEGGLVRQYPMSAGSICGPGNRAPTSAIGPARAWCLPAGGWGMARGRFATAPASGRLAGAVAEKLSARDAMVLGTAGLTAMLAVNRLEAEGITPESGPVLVTGAGGGVGSIATLLLSRLGYSVDAMSGRAELADDLKALGAANVVGREVLAPSPKKLLATRWAGAIDNVGGAPLGELLKQMQPGGCVAAVGLAAGDRWDASVVPFILRGVTLAGIDSVMQPFAARVAAWDRLTGLFDSALYERMVSEAGLADLPAIGGDILAGRIRGRVVSNPGA